MPVYFTAHVCGPDRFRCQNHKCIYSKDRCDGVEDCRNGSDEKNCSSKEVFNFSIICNVYLMHAQFKSN